jgi:uncharacterized protein YegP (UPF0339 family)
MAKRTYTKKPVATLPTPKLRARFEIYREFGKDYRWRYLAANHKILATSSEGYRRRKDCVAALEFIRTYAAATQVVDLR